MGSSDTELAALIEQNRAVIRQRFADRIREQGLTPGEMPRSVLVDHLDDLLDELATKLGPHPAVLETARAHAEIRWEAGFDLSALVLEYGVLRSILVDLAHERGGPQPSPEWDALSSTMIESAASAVKTYTHFRDERDARQRRQTEEARAELEAMFTAAPLGFALFDRGFRYRMVNRKLAIINGLPPEAHIGKTPPEILPDLPLDALAEVSRRVFQQGESLENFPFDMATNAAPGVLRHFLTHFFPVRVGDAILGACLILEDVTERRWMEASRDRIVGIVSHDLRNPISALLTGCALLSRVTDPEVARVAARMQQSATRMSHVVGQLYDYARLDALGHLPLAREHVDLGELARRGVEEATLASTRDDVRVDVDVRGDARGWWDGSRVAQVVANLVGNALQHGRDWIAVRVLGGADDVTLEVENAGAPIPPAVLSRAFEPFAAGTHDREHLGLGLFITREIVRAHGGSIDARSTEKSTLFRARLPRQG